MRAIVSAPVVGRRTLHNTYVYGGGTGTILIDGSETGGAYALLDAIQRPGAEPPLHVHEREDETFYVLEGSMAFWVGGQVHRLEAGDSIFLPRAVPHTFRIKSPVARGLNYISPAGFEEWFRTLGKPADSFELPDAIEPLTGDLQVRAMELAPKLGVRIIGPSPEF
jgi:quercetin dioxygenase-like cupin family protein